jgi:hypothetical protein
MNHTLGAPTVALTKSSEVWVSKRRDRVRVATERESQFADQSNRLLGRGVGGDPRDGEDSGDASEKVVLVEVEIAGCVDGTGSGAAVSVPAPTGRAVVHPVRVHPPLTQSTMERAGQPLHVSPAGVLRPTMLLFNAIND